MSETITQDEIRVIIRDLQQRRKELSKLIDPMLLRMRDYVARGFDCSTLTGELSELLQESASLTKHIDDIINPLGALRE